MTESPREPQTVQSEPWPEMPEIRMLLSLRTHESRMRRRLALCDELCGLLETMYRGARALAASRLGIGEGEPNNCIKNAPASVHTICSMVRDLAGALAHVLDLVETGAQVEEDPATASAESPILAVARKTLFKGVDEHTALRSWKDVAWIGLSHDSRRRLEFRWSVAMECLRTNPQKGYPALRPVVLLARRLADDAMALLDPLTGPIAEERASAYAITKKLRAQIDHIRTLVNRKCDALEGEMRAVQNAIIKAQSQTMSLVKSLSTIGASE